MNVSIQKAPKTDSGTKKSAKGFLIVDKAYDGFVLSQDCNFEDAMNNGDLQTVFKDGKITQETTFQEIRQRLNTPNF